MTIFTFIHNSESLKLRDREIIDMEKKFNLTNLGSKYSYIGDALYNLYIGRDGSINRLIIADSELYEVLRQLSEMSYEEVRKECRAY